MFQVTGLYAESHGVVSGYMYDPVSHKHFSIINDSDPMWWNEAEPIWLTALNSGYKTATAMWPGSDVVIRNRTATHFFPYNSRVTFRQRLGNITKWLLGEGKVENTSCVALCSQTYFTYLHSSLFAHRSHLSTAFRFVATILHSVPHTLFHQEQGVMFAALYWEEPDRSGHIFGPDNVTIMGKVLKEV